MFEIFNSHHLLVYFKDVNVISTDKKMLLHLSKMGGGCSE